MILFSLSCIKTAKNMNPEIIVSSIMTVPTSFLKLNAKMTSGSMENQKKTDLILSFKWDCLWMAMASLYAAKLERADNTAAAGKKDHK